MVTILAIDLGKFKSVVCWYAVGSGEAKFQTVPSSRAELQQALTARPVDLVVFEACTLAGWMYDLCRELKRKVQVANTGGEAWKWKNVKRKTDKDDALKLARLAALGQLPQARIPGKAVREKRALLSYRQGLVGRRVAVQNRIRAVLLAQGLPAPRGHRAWTACGLAGIGQFATSLADCAAEELWRGELDLALTELRQVLELIAQVEKKLDALAKSDAGVQLLQSIPGVGPRTAETVAAYLDQAGRFDNGRQVSAYAGLVPRQFESGETSRKGRITRRGPGLLRKMLVECAWIMLRYNGWAQRLGATAGAAHQSWATDPQEAGGGGGGAETAGAHVGHAPRRHALACRAAAGTGGAGRVAGPDPCTLSPDLGVRECRREEPDRVSS